MASLFDSASLVMIPSGYKDDKLYSIKPTNGDGDFTFSRDGSGASPATRVGSDGYIEKGRTNEILQSNQFDTTWATYNGTVTSGATDMNGGSNAWTLAKTGTYGDVGQTVSVTGVYTFSVYAKAGTLDHLQLSNSASPFMGVMFDLTNGTVASEANNIAAKITDMGSGWYRCEAAVNQTASGEWRLQPADTVGGVPNANLGNVIIFQAQLEQGLVSTDYIETTTAAVSAGLLGDMPRLDYSGGASCPSLKLEPSRVNLVTQSEYFGDSAWTATDYGSGAGAPTITANAALSPEGVQNAYQIDFPETVGAEQSAMQYSYTSVISTTYTHSIYLKGDVASTLILRDATNGETAISVTTDWQRFDVSATAASTTSSLKFGLRPVNGSQTDACTIYAWGAQAEEGSYPTSYIPTYGSASTRAHDVCKIIGTSIVDNQEMTLYGNVLVSDNSATDIIAIIRDLTGGFYDDFISLTLNTSSQARFEVRANAAPVSTIFSSVLSDGYHKIAVTLTSTSIKLFVDGALSASATISTIPNDLDEIYLAGYPDATNRFGTKKEFVYFPTALTDAECINLTTI